MANSRLLCGCSVGPVRHDGGRTGSAVSDNTDAAVVGTGSVLPAVRSNTIGTRVRTMVLEYTRVPGSDWQ